MLNYHLLPNMPCKKVEAKHRSRIDTGFHIPACVARPVTKKEILLNPTLASGSCLDAITKEWKRLWERKVWCGSSVREWRDVARQARIEQRTIHMGRIFGIMVEKNHELKEDDPNRKFKYRVVF